MTGRAPAAPAPTAAPVDAVAGVVTTRPIALAVASADASRELACAWASDMRLEW